MVLVAFLDLQVAQETEDLRVISAK